MPSELNIEKVDDTNFNEFLFLIDRLAEYEKLSPPDDQARTRLRNDAATKDPKYQAFIGRVNGMAVAYIIYFFNYSSFLARPTLYLEDVFVLEEHRRKGYGKKLFEFCIGRAKERECGRIEFCVLTWNEPAQKFYEKMNAQRLDWYFYRLDIG